MEPLEKSLIKLIRLLEQKKYRTQHGLFVVEGDKTVREILGSPLITEYLLAKPAWLEQQPVANANRTIKISDKELSQISFLKTPNQAMALVRIPQYPLDMAELTGGLSLYLDQVQDPGNLGTIIRLADWFGIRHVLCGEGCADPFNPKTVQSTMGAFIRVKTHPASIAFFDQLKAFIPDFPIYGTFLNGKNIYETPLLSKAVIVMGNESKGISDEAAPYVNRRLLIPSYPPGEPTSESLNVATAAAIVCAEFRRMERGL
ncbi:MAG: RNA methyltransferase [Bacteroidales bacterium]|nr:RNA methyltransferase [Bacteroidales bacterium]